MDGAVGVILAGGRGTRMRPATFCTNKHMLSVINYPMILFPLTTLRDGLGIKKIMIISGGEHVGAFADFLGDGSEYGVELTYRVQKDAGGIAEAIGLARDFVGTNDVWVILGDNIYSKSGMDELKDVEPRTPFVVLSEVDDNRRFGVPVIRKDGKITSVIEKPQYPPNKYAVTGLYHYPPEVFGIIEKLNPSSRGEKEVSDINNAFAIRDELEYRVFDGFWTDCGTPESMITTVDWLGKHPGGTFVV